MVNTTQLETTRTAIILTPQDASLAPFLEELLWTLDGVDSVMTQLDDNEQFQYLQVIGPNAHLPEAIVGLLRENALDNQVTYGSPQTIEEADWAECWKQYWHVTRLLPNLVIQPSWESFTPTAKDIVLRLDPGSAFGTGTHETTQLMLFILRELRTMAPRADALLDVGTGSGILAIYAAKLGYTDIVTIDNDPLAVKVVTENAAINQVSFPASTQTLDQLPVGHFDVVLANILAVVLIEMMPELKNRLAPRGYLALSGIAANQFPQVHAAIQANGLVLRRIFQKGPWIALVVQRRT